MRLISCDLCGKSLNPDTESRFTWKIEGFPTVQLTDDECTILDDDAEGDLDTVDSVDELLLEREDHDSHENRDTVEMLPVCVQRNYDLCGSCYSRMLNDPLGLESRQARPFSRN